MRYAVFLATVCCWLCPALSLAALFVDAPAEALQGSAVLIRLSSDEAASEAAVHWQETKFSVPMTADRGMYGALALVPVPLDAAQPLNLRVTAGKSSVSLAIRPLKVAWPRQEISGVEKKYVSPPPEVLKRIEAEQRKVRAVLARISPERWWEMPCVRPAPGDVSSVFGGERVFNGQPRSRHRGADLRAETGQPIMAMAGGKVALAEEQYFSGKVVFIDHGLGLVSLYAHLSALRVAEGDTVRAGQLIGLAGATGRVTGPHLHWGVNILGKAVDPLSLLSTRSAASAGTR